MTAALRTASTSGAFDTQGLLPSSTVSPARPINPLPQPPPLLEYCTDFWSDLPKSIRQKPLRITLNDAAGWVECAEKTQALVDLTARRLAGEEPYRMTPALQRHRDETPCASSDTEHEIETLEVYPRRTRTTPFRPQTSPACYRRSPHQGGHQT